MTALGTALMRRQPLALVFSILLLLTVALQASGVESDAPPHGGPFAEIYGGHRPDFVKDRAEQARRREGVPEEVMKLSCEKSFYTLCLLPESDRAYALVAAAAEQEKAGRYREALEIYQKVIDEYPDAL
ncbi:MAG: tetratricopeptide repeat protein, partial [Kiritimatiellia bacterium]